MVHDMKKVKNHWYKQFGCSNFLELFSDISNSAFHFSCSLKEPVIFPQRFITACIRRDIDRAFDFVCLSVEINCLTRIRFHLVCFNDSVRFYTQIKKSFLRVVIDCTIFCNCYLGDFLIADASLQKKDS